MDLGIQVGLQVMLVGSRNTGHIREVGRNIEDAGIEVMDLGIRGDTGLGTQVILERWEGT